MKKIAMFVIPVVVILGLITWRVIQKQAENASIQQQSKARGGQAPNVVLATAGPLTVTDIVESVGTVESPYNVKLSPKVAGRINYLEVREGASVKPGQVLVRIDPTEIEGQVLQQQAAVAEARSRLAQAQLGQESTNVGVSANVSSQAATLESAQADLNQVQTNYSSQVAAAQSAVADADAKVAAARSQVANAEANLESAKANLENAQIKFDRVNGLYKQGFIAAQDVDDARAALKTQQGAVNVAEGQVSAAKSALTSAQAQRSASANQASIVAKKGKSDIAASQAKVKQAKAGLAVASANRSQGPAYQENISALRAAVAAAEAELAQAQARRADTELASPIEGVVTARSADPGTTASPGTPILTIQYLKWLYVTTSIPVENSQNIVTGTPTTVTFDSLKGVEYQGRVADINPSADPASRQVMVRIRLDNSKGELKPGMYARVRINRGTQSVTVAVPREAVDQDSDGNQTVTVVDSEMVAHVVPVKTGIGDTTHVAIVEGVKEGDKVVTLSYSPVRDKQKVREGGPPGGKGAGAGGRGRGAGKGSGSAGGTGQ